MKQVHMISILAGGAYCIAGTSAAQFNYIDTFSEANSRLIVFSGFLDDSIPRDSPAPLNGAYDYSDSYDSTDDPAIGSAVLNATGQTVQSSSELSIAINADTQLVLSEEATNDGMIWQHSVIYEYTFSVPQDTLVTVSFGGSGTLPAVDSNNEVIYEVESELGSFVNFAAGINNPDSTITSAFSFDVTLLAGDEISVLAILDHDTVLENQVAASQSIDSFFSIEVVPAPGAGITLGTFGLLAARRRRRAC